MHACSNQISNRRAGLIRIHCAVFLFGFAGLLGKSIDSGPALITFGRTFFAAIALFCCLAATGQRLSVRTRRDLLTLCVSGLLLALHWYAFFKSIQVSSVAVGLLTFSTFPIFTTFMEPFFFREKLHLFDMATSLLVVAGLMLIAPSFDFSNNVTRGALWGVVSGFLFSALALLNRMQVGRYPPLTVTFYQLGFATLFNLPFALHTGLLPSAKDILLLLVLGCLCTALAHALFIAGLRHIRAQLASVTAGLEPVYGIVLAFLLLGETPEWRTILGGLIILSAVFLPAVRPTRPFVGQG